MVWQIVGSIVQLVKIGHPPVIIFWSLSILLSCQMNLWTHVNSSHVLWRGIWLRASEFGQLLLITFQNHGLIHWIMELDHCLLWEFLVIVTSSLLKQASHYGDTRTILAKKLEITLVAWITLFLYLYVSERDGYNTSRSHKFLRPLCSILLYNRVQEAYNCVSTKILRNCHTGLAHTCELIKAATVHWLIKQLYTQPVPRSHGLC